MTVPIATVVKLRCGAAILVDARDVVLVEKYHWYVQRKCRAGVDKCYVQRNAKIDGAWTTVFLHREITSTPSGLDTDHKNGNGLDNWRKNLRTATRSQNNTHRSFANATGFRGVGKTASGRFQAAIHFLNKRVALGTFQCPEDAARAYDAAALKSFGEFAQLNFQRRGAA